ncbi:hypothetical protein J2Z82_002559 [Virgibacillus litoralis]|uniref:Uncharacterized protein n=1 Tax=Virgibacillus litoralis TaxID=578221 RepID=A0ABS4HG70_9BACI|nr:hypothetical protein [Virgibacillus litoralis]
MNPRSANWKKSDLKRDEADPRSVNCTNSMENRAHKGK